MDLRSLARHSTSGLTNAAWRSTSSQPGRPVENAFVEIFNGRFRDECLNEHWFRTLDEARAEIETWRRDHNDVRDQMRDERRRAEG